jgi:hypothetical protein
MPASWARTWSKPVPCGRAEFLNPNHCMRYRAITHPKMPHSPTPLSNDRNWCWPVNQKVHQAEARLISSQRDWLQAFPFQQFHVLFNSLSKVLFIFPSRYLFAIGLSPIFSFRWHLPPILSCIPKQLDSSRAHHNVQAVRVKDGILTLCDAPFQETCTRSSTGNTSLDYNSDGQRPSDFKFELFPLHSQLLGESLLVSFPPLIDMLKFSG